MNGEDLRRKPLEDRKRRLVGLLRPQHEGIAINEAFSGDGAVRGGAHVRSVTLSQHFTNIWR